MCAIAEPSTKKSAYGYGGLVSPQTPVVLSPEGIV